MKASQAILVTMPDHSQWLVPAELVAHNRADFYRDDGYKEEFDFVMSDKSELLDWAANNMNWDEVAPYAVRYQVTPPLSEQDKQEGWVNGEKNVISIPQGVVFPEIPECK